MARDIYMITDEEEGEHADARWATRELIQRLMERRRALQHQIRYLDNEHANMPEPRGSSSSSASPDSVAAAQQQLDARRLQNRDYRNVLQVQLDLSNAAIEEAHQRYLATEPEE